LRNAIVAGVLVLTPFWLPQARASTITESFSVAGAGFSGSGTLTFTTTADPAVDDVTGVTGFFSTTNGSGFSGSIAGLDPGSYSSTSPSTAFSGLLNWDNLFYPEGGAPGACNGPPGALLDTCGFTFLLSGGQYVNVFGSGPNAYEVLDGDNTTGTPVDDSAPASFVLSPEPPGFWLTLAALLALAFLPRNRPAFSWRPWRLGERI
jgi:hypothetical protein